VIEVGRKLTITTYHAKTTNITQAKAFTITFRYIDDVLSINDPNFAKWIPLIYLK
jgi:hypothetical protein